MLRAIASRGMNSEKLAVNDEIVVFTSINDEDVAQEFVQELLQEQLILSGTIFPGAKVMYVWEGQVTLDTEYKIMLKAREGHYAGIEEYIMKKHPYLAPEIIKFQVSFGSPDFRKFLMGNKKLSSQ